ncbi:MAG: purine-nucleoside phosphorylase [Firmicutes bacterium]|nr:purine-nucleoside phosphorylase [Bacillota bacterium]
MSNHIAAKKGQIAESILLPGDPLRAKFIAENFLTGAEKYNDIRNMFGYTGTYKGVPVSVQGSGMGMPSMGIYSWELMNDYGVQNLVRIGTAGSFNKGIRCRDIVVALSASTDSNYAANFALPGTYAPTCSYDLLVKTQKAAEENNISFKAGNVVSVDVFYDLQEGWKKWAEMGVLCVDMEAAALYMNASWLGRNALTILTISNDFLTGEETTAEEREKTFTDMMKLALEAVIK